MSDCQLCQQRISQHILWHICLIAVCFKNLQALIHTIFGSAPFLFFFCFYICKMLLLSAHYNYVIFRHHSKLNVTSVLTAMITATRNLKTEAIWRRPSPPSQIQNHLLVFSPHRRVREDSSSIQKFINAASLQLLLLFGEDISFSMSSNLFCKRKIFVPSLPRLTELWKRMHMGGPCLAWRPFLDNQLHP